MTTLSTDEVVEILINQVSAVEFDGGNVYLVIKDIPYPNVYRQSVVPGFDVEWIPVCWQCRETHCNCRE